MSAIMTCLNEKHVIAYRNEWASGYQEEEQEKEGEKQAADAARILLQASLSVASEIKTFSLLLQCSRAARNHTDDYI